MKHIVVDIEMNCVAKKSEVRSFCSMETIEIGAVMLDDNLQEISAFRTYVKPEYNDCIDRKIKRLTGITEEMVQNAPVFNEALRMFTNWCLGTEEVTIYAWSDTDYCQITREIELKKYEMIPEEETILVEKWSDFQNEFDTHLGFNKKLSLSMALDMAGINFTGREHDALDDARNTAELLNILKNTALFNLTLKKIKEAMEPSKISNTMGELFDFSAFASAG